MGRKTTSGENGDASNEPQQRSDDDRSSAVARDMRSQVWTAVVGVGTLIAIGGVLASSDLFSLETVREFVKPLGVVGPIAMSGVYALSVVVSPVAGSPFILASLLLWGFGVTLLVVYVGNLVGASVAFWLARRLGRPIILRILGVRRLAVLDELTCVVGVRSLLILRLVGGGLFDVISYAAGVTLMRFRDYFLITAIASVPSLAILVWLLAEAVSASPWLTAGYTAVIVLLTIGLPILLFRYERKRLGRR